MKDTSKYLAVPQNILETYLSLQLRLYSSHKQGTTHIQSCFKVPFPHAKNNLNEVNSLPYLRSIK